jgi:hypothetical protein
LLKIKDDHNAIKVKMETMSQCMEASKAVNDVNDRLADV